MTVTLGKKSPAWSLSRWAGNSGLRFVPFDDEGFTRLGNKQQLLYKGRQRSHRFTILGDTAFEYDCILNRQPKNNVISLLMEGAEKFDFLRQPDFVEDPFLQGSYAVYKKETLIGDGTGKLCHIHRPLIIDARGRRCWGDLSVAGDELRITIPEGWLADAAYPVIVDPTVGTTTIGSQITGTDPSNSGYDRPWLDCEYALNKYLIPQNGSGLCTAYVYCYNADTEDYAIPILYTNENNKPYKRKSKNEQEIEVWVWGSSKPAGWRNNTFTLDGNITAGEYVWFGLYSGWFTTRFDYGGECYKGQFNWDLYPDYEEEGVPPYIHIGPDDRYCTIKWSMYFNYTAVTSQNFVRTLTQGVSLADSRILNIGFERSVIDEVKVGTLTKGLQTLFRKLQEGVQGIDDFSFPVLFLRSLQETLTVTETINNLRALFRGLFDDLEINSDVRQGKLFFLTLTETVQAAGAVFRGLVYFVRIVTGLLVRDYLLGRFLKAREELILKSAISTEIHLDSTIQ